jgi:hypothetical protein
VGFYSAFMVGDAVEVTSRSYSPEEPGHTWASTGSGSYTIGQAENATRGSRIVIKLKESCKEFAKPARVKEIIKKYSNFVNFPIKVWWVCGGGGFGSGFGCLGIEIVWVGGGWVGVRVVCGVWIDWVGGVEEAGKGVRATACVRFDRLQPTPPKTNQSINQPPPTPPQHPTHHNKTKYNR